MSDSRLLENNLVKIIAAIGFLIFAYFAIQVFFGVYTTKLTKQLSGPAEAQKAKFQEQIEAETDAYKATRLGVNFDKSQNNDLALLALQKATQLDPQYRDAWVMKGYSELKNNQPNEALSSLKKAEEIDPINARTYELLKIAYTQTGDTDSAKKAEEKWEYLTK